MFLDVLFQLWRRGSASLQWRLLWLVNAKFMASVSGVIFDKAGRILLQRHRHWVPEVWGLPGGIVQSGETLPDALIREVREETGLAIADVELIKVMSGYRLRIEFYYRARLAQGGEPQEMKLQKQEVLEAKFFPLSELPGNILPVQRKIIEMAGDSQTAYASESR